MSTSVTEPPTSAMADAQTQPSSATPTGSAQQSNTTPMTDEKQAGTTLTQLTTRLPKILSEADYDEVYGVHLSASESPVPFSTTLILQKFLRANADNVDAAATQLLETLKWRKTFQPLKLLENQAFSQTKFSGLGYVTELGNVPESVRPEGKEIVTFNIYGAVKDKKATFGDVDEFLRWRVALMELSIAKLKLATTTIPIPAYGQGLDPHQAIQVHDYLSVSFLRQDPNVKAATKVTIDTFTKYYPETLSRKFFVNVPVVMGWMFKAATMVLSKETVRKFTVLSYGSELAGVLGKDGLPKEYGGSAEGLDVVGEQLGMQ